ncbi:MAG TPA: A24 family peptidase [Steroidobacteraceae bacterium]|nr:A24 family peptidase [Steroidobacteraceae bacterium]
MELFEPLAAIPALYIGCCVVLGLLIGSFLNVVIYRVPVMMENALRAECASLANPDSPPALPAFNLMTPRSACPKCKAPITALQNIPVVSWLALGRKCANCKAPISARYPLVELFTGIASGVIAWRFGFGTLALGALFFTWSLIALTMIDFDTQLLPDELTYPLLWIGLLLSTTHPVWAPGAAPVTPADSIVGAMAGYLSLWSIYWIFRLIMKKEGMGYGDFKLFAAFGAWFGWRMLLPIILFASLVGSVVGLYVLYRQRKGLETPIPFGPFLAAAGWLVLLFGHQAVDRYLGLYAQAR